MVDRSRIAPELRGAIRRVPPVPFGNAMARRLMRLTGRALPVPKVEGVAIDRRDQAGAGLFLYRPERRQTDAALLWIHGGGHVIGSPAQDHRRCAAIAAGHGLLVVSTAYRLSPENPFPAALDDCHAAWRWLQAQADALAIDPKRIVVAGQSAGGCLAAGLVQRLHDEPGPDPLAQWLFCPMLDDRTAAEPGITPRGHAVWDNRSNAIGWGAYLGRPPGGDAVPPYAVPARRTDLTGLPPAWIGVGGADLFCAEDSLYAKRLREAGVATVLDIVPGGPHGFDAWAPDKAITKAFLARAEAWLAGVIG